MKCQILPSFVAVALFTAFALSSCSTVEDTGRKQVSFIPAAKQKEMGLSEFQKYKQQKKISRDPNYNGQLQRVAARLTKVITMAGAEWEFVVFEDDTPNAFALPGGKVGVHTGLFQITQNEASLAAVVGHEIGHVKAGHSGERMSQQILAGVGTAAAGVILNRNEEMSRGRKTAILAGVGVGATGAVLKFSRTQELEADELGALYMARAGYDPRESIGLWERFSKFKGGGGAPQFMSTHPSDSTRIARLEAYMPQVVPIYEQNR
ncbi:MAG: putative Zn-dependent protease [Verrucomicrobiales bacterium]|jgi:predicted Zn-dependent protease